MGLRTVDTRADAQQIFETFHDRKVRRATTLPFGWPKQMQEIGVGKAEMYRSNKWKSDLSVFEEYKHVVESTRTVYAVPGFVRAWHRPGVPIAVCGEMMTFEDPMPQHFSVLGPLLGLQVRLFQCDSSDGPSLHRGDGEAGGWYEITVARAKLGGAVHPGTQEKFLFVYDTHGIHIILTGSQLDIEKDGIVG
jgi:hypothetical protein